MGKHTPRHAFFLQNVLPTSPGQSMRAQEPVSAQTLTAAS